MHHASRSELKTGASTPIEPVKPAQVPAAAIWVGGVDGGVFVLVEKSEKLGKNVYLGEIHHASGDLAYKGPMQLFPDDAASLDSEMKNSFEGWDGDTLYLNSTQRSCDVPLGLNFNMVQVYFLLAIVAQITGHQPGMAYHKIVNAHIYEDQLDLMVNVQLKREPYPSPKLIINPDIKSLEDLETWVTLDDFDVEGYQHHDAIQYPFSV